MYKVFAAEVLEVAGLAQKVGTDAAGVCAAGNLLKTKFAKDTNGVVDDLGDWMVLQTNGLIVGSLDSSRVDSG